jgi:hypothetical protein
VKTRRALVGGVMGQPRRDASGWSRRRSFRSLGFGRFVAASSAIGLVLVSMAGCFGAGNQIGQADWTSSAPAFARATATSEPTSCGGVSVNVDYGSYVIAGIPVHGTIWQDITPAPDAPDVAADATVVVALTRSVEPGIYNTPDGSAAPGAGGPVITILTPIDVQVERVIRGSAPIGPLTIFVEGGRAACYTMYVDTAPKLELGRRYVLFLYPARMSDGKLHPERLQLERDAWPVDASDVVATYAGPMPLADLAARLSRIPVASPPPS